MNQIQKKYKYTHTNSDNVKWGCDSKNFKCYKYESKFDNNGFKDEDTCLSNCNSLTLLPKDLMTKVMKDYMPRDYFVKLGQTNKFFNETNLIQQKIIEHRLLTASNLKQYLNDKINQIKDNEIKIDNKIQIDSIVQSVSEKLIENINIIINVISYHNYNLKMNPNILIQLFDNISDDIFGIYEFGLLVGANYIYLDRNDAHENKQKEKPRIMQQFKIYLGIFVQFFIDHISKELWSSSLDKNNGNNDDDNYYKFKILHVYNDINSFDLNTEIPEYLMNKLRKNGNNIDIDRITNRYMTEIQIPFANYVSQYLKQSLAILIDLRDENDEKVSILSTLKLSVPETIVSFVQHLLELDFRRVKNIKELLELSKLLDSIISSLRLSQEPINENVETYLGNFIIEFLIFIVNNKLSPLSFIINDNDFTKIFYTQINIIRNNHPAIIWESFFNHFGMWSENTNSIDLSKIKDLRSSAYKIWSEIIFLILISNLNNVQMFARLLIGREIPMIASPIKKELKNLFFAKLDQIFDMFPLVDPYRTLHIWTKINFSDSLLDMSNDTLTDADIIATRIILPDLERIYNEDEIWSQDLDIDLAKRISQIKIS